jgi:hypothetical protein
MSNYVAILLTVLTSFELQAQSIEFFREDLKFIITENLWEVSGDYYFRNTTDNQVTHQLIYPFPTDTSFGEIDEVVCYDLTDYSNRLDTIQNAYMLFTLTIPPNEIRAYRIGYKQKLSGNKAIYILTSTQKWNKPFEKVNYKLISKNVRIDSLSYQPDRVEVFADSTMFYWQMHDFMPDRNFEVVYTKPED